MATEIPEDALIENLRQTYDKYAQERDAHPLPDWKRQERDDFLFLLQKEQKKTMLEIGAGTGKDAWCFQEAGIEVTCIDLSPVNLELCRQKGLMAFLMDMRGMHFPDSSMDAVYSMNSLLHLKKTDFKDVLGRIDRVLKPDGLFFLGMHGGREQAAVWEDDPFIPHRFFSFFTDEDLEKEVMKVFDILSFKKVVYDPTNPLHFQSVVLRKRKIIPKAQ